MSKTYKSWMLEYPLPASEDSEEENDDIKMVQPFKKSEDKNLRGKPADVELERLNKEENEEEGDEEKQPSPVDLIK